MSKNILLSIQVKYIKEIEAGTKKFEFRKKFPDLLEGKISKRIIIYCSKPRKEIMGSFFVRQHLNANFDELMNLINADEKYIDRVSDYFTEKDSCHALEISDYKVYKTPLSLDYLQKKYEGFCPGQSYRYLDLAILNDIRDKNGEL